MDVLEGSGTTRIPDISPTRLDRLTGALDECKPLHAVTIRVAHAFVAVLEVPHRQTSGSWRGSRGGEFSPTTIICNFQEVALSIQATVRA